MSKTNDPREEEREKKDPPRELVEYIY